jgi:hypothetical protein
VRVHQASGELRLLVKINVQGQGAEGRNSKAVKDLKQLSGGRAVGVVTRVQCLDMEVLWKSEQCCLRATHSGLVVGCELVGLVSVDG